MAETLASTLNNSFDPLSTVTSISRGRTAEERGGLARKAYPDIFAAESAAREQVLRAEAEAKKAQIEEESRLAGEFAGKERQTIEEYRAGLQPAPEPQITKFDSGAAAELAVQTALLGALTGFVGAEASLGAVEGFTRGHKQGREDLYKQQVADFERSYKKWKDNNTLARQVLDDSLKLLSTDKTAAMVNLKKLDPLLQSGVILAKARQGDVLGAKAFGDKSIDIENKVDAAIETALGKPPKVSDKQRLAMTQNQELLRRLENLKNTAKKEYFQLAPLDKLAKLRLSVQEVGLGDLAGIFGLDVGNNAVLWWKDYFDLISEERKERFGATLTGNEKQSFRETIVEPSSSYDIGMGVLQRKIDLARQSNQNVMNMLQRETPGQPAAVPAGSAGTDVNTVRQQAQAAIASGKDPAAVRALFKQLTGQDL
jgi:hypothetical protein